MIENKKINLIIIIAVIFALVTSVFLIVAGNMRKSDIIKAEAEYTTKIFGSDIISIEIIANEKDWQQMLDNAINEQFIMADVIVNGTKFQSVGIRPKGNSSLSQVASSDSDRYSFRLQFNEYIKNQTCFGLESFVVNNMIGDYTYMKEYISYDLMKEIGVDAPHFGFADIKVNGEGWGLYLAVELYNSSYEQRVFHDTSGMLYNVKSMEMGGNMQGGAVKNNMPDFNAMPDRDMVPDSSMVPDSNTIPDFGTMPNRDMMPDSSMVPDSNTMPDFGTMPNRGTMPGSGTMPDSNTTSPDNRGSDTENSDNGNSLRDRNQGIRGGFGSSGGSLEYTDDTVESYSGIFNNVVGKGTESDFNRVIKALEKLSKGEELEEYFDVDKILRYLAAHTIVVNLDSYSSSMAQNYYIYENNGKITILPWDYNLAWGGFQNDSASSVINFPIDTPVSGVEIENRPLIEKLFSNPEYLERYHSYLQQLVTEYFADSKFQEKINALDTLIADYVKNDKTAFCTYEEYKTAMSSFITLGNLRSESIQGQLDGTIPSTATAQKEDSSLLIAAGDLNISTLGSMIGGGQRGGFPNEVAVGGQNVFNADSGIDRELMIKVMEIIQKANGDITEDVKNALLALNLTTEQIEQILAMGTEGFGGMGQNGGRGRPNNDGEINSSENNRNPLNFMNGTIQTTQTGIMDNVVFICIPMLLLMAATTFVLKYKKRY